MNNSFITKLTVSVVTVAALLALVAPVIDNGGKSDTSNDYAVSTMSDNDFEFELIKSK